MATTTTTTVNPFPAAAGSPFAPQGLSFPNNDKLTNSDKSNIDDFLIFNPYIHYYPTSAQQTNLTGDVQDVAYRIAYVSDYKIATPWDQYSKEYRDQVSSNGFFD